MIHKFLGDEQTGETRSNRAGRNFSGKPAESAFARYFFIHTKGGLCYHDMMFFKKIMVEANSENSEIINFDQFAKQIDDLDDLIDLDIEEINILEESAETNPPEKTAHGVVGKIRNHFRTASDSSGREDLGIVGAFGLRGNSW